MSGDARRACHTDRRSGGGTRDTNIAGGDAGDPRQRVGVGDAQRAYEKVTVGQLCGWTVIQCCAETIENGQWQDWIEAALTLLGQPGAGRGSPDPKGDVRLAFIVLIVHVFNYLAIFLCVSDSKSSSRIVEVQAVDVRRVRPRKDDLQGIPN